MSISRKQTCLCEGATASGPRFVAKPRDEGSHIVNDWYLYDFACDKCDEPWEEVEEVVE